MLRWPGTMVKKHYIVFIAVLLLYVSVASASVSQEWNVSGYTVTAAMDFVDYIQNGLNNSIIFSDSTNSLLQIINASGFNVKNISGYTAFGGSTGANFLTFRNQSSSYKRNIFITGSIYTSVYDAVSGSALCNGPFDTDNGQATAFSPTLYDCYDSGNMNCYAFVTATRNLHIYNENCSRLVKYNLGSGYALGGIIKPVTSTTGYKDNLAVIRGASANPTFTILQELNRSGNISWYVNYTQTSAYIAGLATGNLTADAGDEIVVIFSYTASSVIWANVSIYNVAGSLICTSNFTATAPSYDGDADISDVNGDGTNEIIYSKSGEVFVLNNACSVIYSATSDTGVVQDITSGDVNQDGKQEIIVTTAATNHGIDIYNYSLSLLQNMTTQTAGSYKTSNRAVKVKDTDSDSINNLFTISNELGLISYEEPPDTTPILNYTSPTYSNNSNKTSRNILVNVTATSGALSSINITLYNASFDQINSSNTSTSPNYINFSVYSDGSYYFNVTSCDTSGKCAYLGTYNITIDSVVPSINVSSPANITYLDNYNYSLNLNVTATDVGAGAISTYWYSLNGGANTSFTPNISIIGLSPGVNSIMVYANDTYNNINSTNITFYMAFSPKIGNFNVSNTTTRYERYNLSNDLVGYWTFDKNYSFSDDVSGLNHNATNQNTSFNYSGKVGSAFSYNGVNDTINLGNILNYSTGFTWSIWVKNKKSTQASSSYNGPYLWNGTTGTIIGTDKVGRLGIDAPGTLVDFVVNNSDFGSQVVTFYGYQNNTGVVAGTFLITDDITGDTLGASNLVAAQPNTSDKRIGNPYYFEGRGHNYHVYINYTNLTNLTINYVNFGRSGYDVFVGQGGGLTLASTGGQYRFLLNGATIIQAGTITSNWQHVVVMSNKTNGSLYVDNTFMGSLTHSALSTNTNTYYLGGGGVYDKNAWAYIDEVRVYNRTLSEAEISQIYYTTNPTFQELPNVTINVSIMDEDTPTSSLYYKWYVNNSVFAEGFNNYSINTNITGKNVNVTVYVNDTQGYYTSQYWNVTTNSIVLAPTILYPSNNTNYSTAPTWLNFTWSEANPDKCWYSNQTTYNSTPITCANFSSMVSIQGRNNWTLYMNDTLGNLNWSTVTFIYDIISPNINITSPANQTYIDDYNYTLYLNVTATDQGVASISKYWYSLNGGANTSFTPNTTISGLVAGMNNLTVYANDTVNNINSTNVSFYLAFTPRITDLNISNGTQSYKRYNISQDLAAYWSFDMNWTNITDDSNNGSNGNASGAAAWNSSGVVGGSYYFNNGTGGIYYGNPANLRFPNNQTICMWLYPITVANSRRNPYNKEYGGSGTITQEMAGSFNYYWGLSGADATPYQGFGSGFSITNSAWSFICIVRGLTPFGATNGTLVWYKNGVFSNSGTASYNYTVPGTASFRIGSGYAGNYYGMIDEVRVYNRTLDAGEIAYLYSITKPTFQENANVTINVTAVDTDTNVSTLYYKWYINGTLVKEGINNNSMNRNYTASASNVTLIVNDSQGYSVTQYWNITTNITAPNVVILYPSNGTNFSARPTWLNFTFTENNPDKCWYTNDSGTNSTPVVCANFSVMATREGYNYWRIYMNDSVGQVNFTNTTFLVDLTYPRVGIVGPLNNTNWSNGNFSFNYTYNETYVRNCWWTNNSGSTNNTVSCTSNISQNWTYGKNTVRVYVNDTSGNVNFTETVFYVDSTPPQLTLLSPLNQTYLNQYNYNVTINLTYTDNLLNASTYWYSLNGAANTSFTPNTTIIGLVAGMNNLTVYTNDTANNLNYTSVSFYLMFPPKLVDSNISNSSITFSYNNVTSGLISWYRLDEDWFRWQKDSSPMGNNATYSTIYNDTPLRALLPFNNNANDSSANSLVTIANNLTYNASGKLNQAAQFDGVSSYFNITNLIANSDVKQSWSMWIYPTDMTKNNTLFSFGNSTRAQLYTNGTLNVVLGSTANTNGWISITSSQNISPNSWSHIVVTMAGKTAVNQGRQVYEVEMYINDVLQNETASYSTGDNAVSTLAYVGRDSTGSANFTGLIDDLRIFYGVQLNQGDVDFIYSSGNGTEQNLSLPYYEEGVFGDAKRIYGAIGINNMATLSSPNYMVFNWTTDFTWSMWVKLRTNQGIASIPIMGRGFSQAIQTYYTNATHSYYEIMIRNATISQKATAIMPINQWHLLVGTYNATSRNLCMHYDGVMDSSCLNTNVNFSSIASLQWGNQIAAGNQVYFDGWFDEFRIYNRTISANESQYLYWAKNPLFPERSNITINASITDEDTSSSDLYFKWYANNTLSLEGYNNATFNYLYTLNYTNVTLYVNDTQDNVLIQYWNVSTQTIYPVPSFVSPVNNTNFSYTNITLNYTWSETNPDDCWWTNDSGVTNYSLTNCTTNITGNWSEGINNVTLYMNDTIGQTNSTTILFRVDLTPPNINITSPGNSTYLDWYNITLNITVTDNLLNWSNIWYSLNGGANTSFSSNTTISGAVGSGNTITVWANDTVGNMNSTSVNFTLQYKPRLIDFTLSNFTTSDNTWIDFNGNTSYAITSPNMTGGFVNETVTLSIWFKPLSPGIVISELGQTTPNSAWHDSQIEVLASGEVKVRVWNLASLSIGNITFGSWNHAVLRYNKINLALMGALNGVVTTSNITGDRLAPWESTSSLYYALGVLDSTEVTGGTERPFNGSMDEFRIYNRNLSDQEILEIYNSGLSPNSSLSSDGLVAWFSFNYSTSYNLSSHNATYNLSLNNGTNFGTSKIYRLNESDIYYGLLGYWRFDKNTTAQEDSSGNGRNGSVLTGSTWNSSGAFGGAYTFPMSNTGMTFSAISTPINYTIACWAYFPLPASAGGYRTLVGHNGGTYHHLLINSAGIIGIWNNSWYSPNYNTSALSGWHFIVSNASGSNTSFFIDGVYVGDAPAKIISSDMGIIGAHSTSSTQNAGTLDEVRIYNRSLSYAEIQYLYSLRNATYQELANVTFNVTTADNDTIGAQLFYNWFVDGVSILSGFAQNVFSYLFVKPTTTVNLLVNDSQNYFLNQTWYITTTGVSPLLTITEPLNATYKDIYSFSLNLSITVSDAGVGVNQTWYSLNGGANTSFNNSANMTGLVGGANTVQVWANDSQNNVNSTNVTFYLSFTPRINLGNISNSTTNYTRTLTVNDSLIDYYTFDKNWSNLEERINQSPNGTMTGTLSYTAGKIGGAYVYNSSIASYFNVSTKDITLNNFTFLAWIYPYNVTGRFEIMDIYAKYFNIQNGKLSIYMNAISASYFQHTTNVPTYQWSFVGASWNGTHTGIYLNGVWQYTARTGTAAPLSIQGGIGVQMYGGPNSYFSGIIDEIRIYNTSISESDVEKIYRSTNPVFEERGDITINVSVVDEDSSSLNYTWYVDNVYNTSGVNLSNISFKTTSQYTKITLNVFDSLGYNVTQDWNVTTNLVAPVVTIINPTNQSTMNDYNFTINYTWSDPAVTNCWWSNNSGATNNSLTDCNTNISTQLWRRGNQTVLVYVNDSYGTVGYTSVDFWTKSCNLPASGNWEVDCCDACSIATDKDVMGYNLSIVSSYGCQGTYTTTANITNFSNMYFRGFNTTNRCVVTATNGGRFKY